jgi:hypothetical protein
VDPNPQLIILKDPFYLLEIVNLLRAAGAGPGPGYTSGYIGRSAEDSGGRRKGGWRLASDRPLTVGGYIHIVWSGLV